MLKNIVNQQEIKNRQQYPKNNFFCYRWRVVDNFNRSIERQMFHLNVHGANNHKSLMADKVLRLYKSRYQGANKHLVVNLAQNAMDFLDQRRAEHSKSSTEQVLYATAMGEMVERCFELLLSFSTELNTLLGLSELFITATEPNWKAHDKEKETVQSNVQCRFSTSLDSLVVEGRRDRIVFYMMPADELISVEDVSVHYEPVAKWTASLDGNGYVHWKTGGFNITDDVLEVFCIQLLSQLLDKTKERLCPTEISLPKDQRFELMEADPWVMQTQQAAAMNAGNSIETASSTTIGRITEDDNLGWKSFDDTSDGEQAAPQEKASSKKEVVEKSGEEDQTRQRIKERIKKRSKRRASRRKRKKARK